MSDQFSIAHLGYEMLTGQKPYGSSYREAKSLKSFQKLRYQSALQHNPLVPNSVDLALEKALQIQASARYSSLSEFVQDLKRPKPKWLRPVERPFIERNPLQFWQLFDAIGWLGFLTLLNLINT